MHSHDVTKNNTGGSDAMEFKSTNCFLVSFSRSYFLEEEAK